MAPSKYLGLSHALLDPAYNCTAICTRKLQHSLAQVPARIHKPRTGVALPQRVSPRATSSRTPAVSPSPFTPAGGPRQPAPLSSSLPAPGRAGPSFSQLPSWVPAAGSATATLERGAVDTSLTRYRRHSKAGAVVDATCEARDGKVVVRVTASYVNVPHVAPSELMLHWWVGAAGVAGRLLGAGRVGALGGVLGCAASAPRPRPRPGVRGASCGIVAQHRGGHGAG
jgi:hypothetical protein